MGPLWNVRVIKKGHRWIDLEVSMCHPHAGDFAEDPVFALLLLTAQAYAFDKNYRRIPASPLGEAIHFDDSYLPNTVKARVSEFVEKVVIYDTQNVPFDEDEQREKIDQQVIADGIERDTDEWEDVWQDYWSNLWADKYQLPNAKYRIYVTDDKWISHMESDDAYDTPAFSEDGPWITEERYIPL
eukprot:gene9715-10553_t